MRPTVVDSLHPRILPDTLVLKGADCNERIGGGRRVWSVNWSAMVELPIDPVMLQSLANDTAAADHLFNNPQLGELNRVKWGVDGSTVRAFRGFTAPPLAHYAAWAAEVARQMANGQYADQPFGNIHDALSDGLGQH